MPDAPRLVRWTDHALVKADVLGIARSDVEDAVLRRHHTRERNAGAGAWLVAVGRLAVVYEHPDHGDPLTARIVTLWRRR